MFGTEFIVDVVSLQGRHKIMDIWKYKRTAVNGAEFVYDTKELISCEGEVQKVLIDYTRSVLDAVGMMNGPSHNEIVMTTDGPVLVEVNARGHTILLP